jgi:LysM repeat protein
VALASQKIPSSRSSSRASSGSTDSAGGRFGAGSVIAIAAIGAATLGGVLLIDRGGGDGATTQTSIAAVVESTNDPVPQYAPALVDPIASAADESTAAGAIDVIAYTAATDGAATELSMQTAPELPATPPSGPKGNGFDGTTPVAAPQQAAPADASTPGAKYERGMSLAATDPIAARRLLSDAVLSGMLPAMEATKASEALSAIGRQLVFNPSINANDPCFFTYKVQAGDSLGKIVRQQKVSCDPLFIARINGMKNPNALAAGKRLKLPKGPISAVIWKRDYRLDLVMFQGDERVVLTSMPVGLGSANGTPTGTFQVRPGSKLLDPEWRHPHTGEFFDSKDPKNPIGEHWLGLQGVEESNSALEGYGIHGTIEPESIGRDMSLGCVRLLADDVAIAWEALKDGAEVTIR